jgi:predicted DNA-binding mobile mystery protein A
MNNRWLTIKQLDKQLQIWRKANEQYIKPQVGWVKTIREALSMTTEQLAERLNLKRGRVAQLEQAEIEGAITLKTLTKVADALGCELVYAIIPKREKNLEEIINAQAEEVATRRIKTVSHTMSLESQGIDEKIIKKQKKILIRKLAENFDKKIWEQPIQGKSRKINSLMRNLKIKASQNKK